MPKTMPILRPDALPELRRYASDADNVWGDDVLVMWIQAYPDEAAAEITRLRQQAIDPGWDVGFDAGYQAALTLAIAACHTRATKHQNRGTRLALDYQAEANACATSIQHAAAKKKPRNGRKPHQRPTASAVIGAAIYRRNMAADPQINDMPGGGDKEDGWAVL